LFLSVKPGSLSWDYVLYIPFSKGILAGLYEARFLPMFVSAAFSNLDLDIVSVSGLSNIEVRLVLRSLDDNIDFFLFSFDLEHLDLLLERELPFGSLLFQKGQVDLLHFKLLNESVVLPLLLLDVRLGSV